MVRTCNRGGSKGTKRAEERNSKYENEKMEILWSCAMNGGRKAAKQALSWKPEGSRRPGRPKDTWRRTIQRDMRTKDLEAEEVECMAQQREEWRRFIADLWAT